MGKSHKQNQQRGVPVTRILDMVVCRRQESASSPETRQPRKAWDTWMLAVATLANARRLILDTVLAEAFQKLSMAVERLLARTTI